MPVAYLSAELSLAWRGQHTSLYRQKCQPKTPQSIPVALELPMIEIGGQTASHVLSRGLGVGKGASGSEGLWISVGLSTWISMLLAIGNSPGIAESPAAQRFPDDIDGDAW